MKYILKFGTKENMENLFNNGEIYMNTISFFQELEMPGIGDKLEGTFEIRNFKDGELTLETNNKHITLKLNNGQISKKTSGHVGNIYSTYVLSDDLLKRKLIHRIDKRMLEFGKYCVIIKDVNKFISLVLHELKEGTDNSNSHNIVKYHDYNKNNHNLSLFDKSHKFSYQKEHRIISYSSSGKPIKFQIGSMEGYAEMHMTESLIKNAIFK